MVDFPPFSTRNTCSNQLSLLSLMISYFQFLDEHLWYVVCGSVCVCEDEADLTTFILIFY